MMLFLDLLLILRNPFFPRYKRMTQYYIIYAFGYCFCLVYAYYSKQDLFVSTF